MFNTIRTKLSDNSYAGYKICLTALPILAAIVYFVFLVCTFSPLEYSAGSEDMLIKTTDGEYTPGCYLDTSMEGAKEIVTPAEYLPAGVYNFSINIQKNGTVKAGLIYDESRNGVENVDGEDFRVPNADNGYTYTGTVRKAGYYRFKFRLTGDAAEGDYILASSVTVQNTRATILYRFVKFLTFLGIICIGIIIGIRYRVPENRNRILDFLVLTIIAVFVGLPMYQQSGLNGVDMSFHLSRLQGLTDSMAAGLLPARVQPGWLSGYGYGVSIFYGDILMYLPAFLHLCGVNLQESFVAYIVIINLLSVYFSFHTFKLIGQSRLCGYAGCILYSCSVEHLYRLYGPGHIGAYGAWVFYPLIVLAFYLLLAEDGGKLKQYKNAWIYLCVGFSGLLLTHMISLLIALAFSVLVCIVCIKRLFRKDILMQVLKAVGSALLLNLWFIIPFLQNYFGAYRISSKAGIGMGDELSAYEKYFADFIQQGKDLSGMFLDDDGVPIVFLLVLILFVITANVRNRGKKETNYVFALSLISCFIVSKAFPVSFLAKFVPGMVKIFKSIQYQSRLSFLAGITVSLLAVLILKNTEFKAEMLKYSVLTGLAAVVLISDMNFFTWADDNSFTASYVSEADLSSATNIGNGEYIPSKMNPAKLTGEVVCDTEGVETEIIEDNRSDLKMQINADNLSGTDAELGVPMIYYKGYSAYTEDGSSLDVYMGEETGLVSFTVPKDYSGKVYVEYKEPVLWRLTEIISLITAAGMIVYAVNPRKSKKTIECQTAEKQA